MMNRIFLFFLLVGLSFLPLIGATLDITLSEDSRGDGNATQWVIAQSYLTSVKLNEVENPDASKTFTMGNKQLKFSYTAPATSDGGFEIEAIGGFSGDLLHIHQHTGNPSDVDLVHFEAEDSDVINIRLNNDGGVVLEVGDHNDPEMQIDFVGNINTTGNFTIDSTATWKTYEDAATGCLVTEKDGTVITEFGCDA